jgi:membrane-associated protease RseP (regulator of RpoE activity)
LGARNAAGEDPKPPKDRPLLHLFLFVATLVSTMVTWMLWSGKYPGTFADFTSLPFLRESMMFGFPFLAFLTVHEFGHYTAARYHRVAASLPFYIPLPFIGVGTMGAVIRIRQAVPSLRKLFDIGAAGPIAGFVVALAVLIFALWTLPEPQYVDQLLGHESLREYVDQFGVFPDEMLVSEDTPPGSAIVIGQTALYWGLSQLFPNVPPMYEMYHYPMLFAAWLGLFFTALNLLPVGQLDGGHILYSLVGARWHRILARGFVLLLLLSGSIGVINIEMTSNGGWLQSIGPFLWIVLAGVIYVYLSRLYNGQHRLIAPALFGILALTVAARAAGPSVTGFGFSGWLVWSFLIVFVLRVDHPPVEKVEALTPGRRALAFLSILIFLLCFSIRPMYTI